MELDSSCLAVTAERDGHADADMWLSTWIYLVEVTDETGGLVVVTEKGRHISY